MKFQKIGQEITDKINFEKEKDEYVPLEQLESLLSESGYMFYGHGTGRSGNSDEVVDSIFREGLRTKDNSLYFTVVGLSAPTPEIKEANRKLGIKEPTMEELKNQLNNWQHLDSKKIIIARLPIEYINNTGDHFDLDGEQFGAFYIQKIQPNGKEINYLDSKYIIGCYDVENQLVRLNKNFERTLSESTIIELKAGYIKVLEKTKNRLSRTKLPFINNNVKVEKESVFDPSFDAVDTFDFPDVDWENDDTLYKNK